MGAVTFSLDVRLVEMLKAALPLSVFVETGTFKGNTVADMAPLFDRLITVEFSEPLWKEAVARFKNESKVEVLLGNSPEVLARLQPTLDDTPTLFWLDAHWCVAENTAGDQSQCPLLDEIRAINRLGDTSVVLIDDARLFLAPPPKPHEIAQWPSFNKIVTALRELNEQHELMVINDVIAFFPKSAGKAVEGYAQKYGIDWLSAANYLKENRPFLPMLEEKEAVIQHQALALTDAQTALAQKDRVLVDTQAALAQKDRALADTQAALAESKVALWDKEEVIRMLSRAVRSYRVAHFILSPRESFGRITRRVFKIFAPRLGNLNQHPPIPLRPISPYVCVTLNPQLPVFSLITPSYNQGHFIERTMRSVLDQGYPNIEYVVQDGGSSDDTVSVLKKYDDRLAGWDSNRDSGQSQGLNLGFARTTGEIMAWLNSDDVLLPGTLARVADYFARHPDVDVVYGNRLLINEDDMQIGRWILPGHDSEVLSWADYVPQETLFWRRSLWEKAGAKVDESFRFAMDWDLLVRFRNAGARFSHIPCFLSAFRVHAQQKTFSIINEVGFQEMDRIRERIHGRVPSRKEIRKAVMPFLARHVAVDMAYRIKTRIGGER